MRTPMGLFIGILLAATTVAVYADTKIEFKSTEGSGTFLSSILIGQGKVRADTGNGMVIIDPTEGSMVMVMQDKKQYTKITKADMKQIGDLMAMMEQQMANMPAEVRQMMASRGTGGAPAQPASVTTDTGEKATVAGKSCRIFRTTQAGRTTQERCLADPSVFDISAADRATMVSAMAFSKDLVESLSKSAMFAQVADNAPFQGGMVPVRVTTIDASGTRSTSELVGVSTATMPADTFAIPAGFKEQKLVMPGRGRGGN